MHTDLSICFFSMSRRRSDSERTSRRSQSLSVWRTTWGEHRCLSSEAPRLPSAPAASHHSGPIFMLTVCWATYKQISQNQETHNSLRNVVINFVTVLVLMRETKCLICINNNWEGGHFLCFLLSLFYYFLLFFHNYSSCVFLN